MDRETKTESQRITDLEAALAHHQREYDLLNQVVIEQAAKIERLERRITSLESNLEVVESRLPDDRDPLAEKPPHY